MAGEGPPRHGPEEEDFAGRGILLSLPSGGEAPH